MNTSTRHIPQHDSRGHTARWGTATLAQSLEIKIYIGSVAEEPMFVNVVRRLVIGRGGSNNTSVDINVADYKGAEKGVSRQHASIEVLNRNLMVADLNSSNGTFLNGQQILPGQRRVLRDSDQLLLGDLLLYIFYVKPDRHM